MNFGLASYLGQFLNRSPGGFGGRQDRLASLRLLSVTVAYMYCPNVTVPVHVLSYARAKYMYSII